MILDTSALFAIVLDEPDAGFLLDRLLRSTRTKISAGTVIEIAAVATRRFAGSLNDRIEYVLTAIDPEIVQVSSAQATIGADAYRRFGIGTGHPANLTFGDCFAYALAKETGEPLLFKGNDFSQTDISPAVK